MSLSPTDLRLDEDRERRREEKRRRRERKEKFTSSEEISAVPHGESKWTEFFSMIFDKEIRIKRDEGEEEKIELDGMLRSAAAENVEDEDMEYTITRRDMALGFMQVLILKNNEKIDVEQDGWNQPIYLLNVE